MFAFLMLVIGLMLLLAGGTGLVTGASALAQRYGVPPLVVGLTIVAFGTSSPELVVNIVGALRNETDLAFGNVVGSNMANLGLVLGVAAVIRPISIQGQVVRRELPLLLLGTVILLVMAMDRPLVGLEPILSRSDGVILLLIFSIFVYTTVGDFLIRKPADPIVNDVLQFGEAIPHTPVAGNLVNWVFVILGIVGLTAGGQLSIVYGAQLAEALGVEPIIIGMVVVAVGTSLPELVTSIIAALNDELDLCLGNVVGSNLFNGLVVLPIAAIVRPLPIPEGGLLDVLVSLLFAAVIVPVFYYGKAYMSRAVGIFLLVAYFAYMTMRVLS